MKLAYCDYIASKIQRYLRTDSYSETSYVGDVGKLEWDLDENGAFASTKKVIQITDVNGKLYKVTVEEV